MNDDVAASRVHPPHGARPGVTFQRWRSLAFLHWPCPSEQLEPLLPEGLHVQAAEGRAWVGVTPFLMRGVRPAVAPALPGWSTFPEINVRTYVTDDRGREGLWFLTLEVARRAFALALRHTVGLPYHFGRMSLVGDEGGLIARWQRRPFHAQGSVTAKGPQFVAEPESLTDFLTGRWAAYSTRLGRLLRTPVHHEPWPLRRAEASGDWSGLLRAGGVDLDGPPAHVLFSPGVDVRIGVSRPA